MSVRMYDPPKAVVCDPVAEGPARQKPRAVHRAGMMLWASLAIGVLNLLLQPSVAAPEAGWIGWVILAGVFAFLILLTLSISAGQNWARVTFLVLFVIGALPYLMTLQQIFAASALFGLLSLLQQLLQIGAMLLVFTRPGSLWFGKDAEKLGV